MGPVAEECVFKIIFIYLMIFLSCVQSQQQVMWTRGNPAQLPVRFAPLPLVHSNRQGISPTLQRQGMPKQTFTIDSGNSLSMGPLVGGKLRLLSTLFGGLRNSGLEASIAGEVIQRLIKTALRDILVPFKKDVLSPMLS